MATLLNSSQKNIDALKLKIQEQKTLLKLNKDDLFLRNIIKTNQNTLNYLQNKKLMKQLVQTDYVIYDKANDNPLQDSYGRVILFGDKEEAVNDCYGNETVVSCTDLPMHWKLELLNQINS